MNRPTPIEALNGHQSTTRIRHITYKVVFIIKTTQMWQGSGESLSGKHQFALQKNRLKLKSMP
jgi:hypothetical protein